MTILTKNTTNRNALNIHYLQKEWLLTFIIYSTKYRVSDWSMMNA